MCSPTSCRRKLRTRARELLPLLRGQGGQLACSLAQALGPLFQPRIETTKRCCPEIQHRSGSPCVAVPGPSSLAALAGASVEALDRSAAKYASRAPLRPEGGLRLRRSSTPIELRPARVEQEIDTPACGVMPSQVLPAVPGFRPRPAIALAKRCGEHVSADDHVPTRVDQRTPCDSHTERCLARSFGWRLRRRACGTDPPCWSPYAAEAHTIEQLHAFSPPTAWSGEPGTTRTTG